MCIFLTKTKAPVVMSARDRQPLSERLPILPRPSNRPGVAACGDVIERTGVFEPKLAAMGGERVEEAKFIVTQ